MDLELRKKYIGGSDIGAILGLNPYATPLTVWLSKKEGYVSKPKDALEFGNLAEDLIMDKVNATIKGNANKYFKPTDPVIYANLIANIDGISNNGKKLLEIKTSYDYEQDYLKSYGNAPAHVLLQMYHYSVMFDKKLIKLAVYCKNTKKIYQIDYTREKLRRLVNTIFGQKFKQKREQAIEQLNAIATKFMLGKKPKARGGAKELEFVTYNIKNGEYKKPDSLCSALKAKKEQINNIKAILKALEKEADGIESDILTADEVTIDFNIVKISEKSSTRIDTAKLRELGLYDQYSKTSYSKKVEILYKTA